MNLLRCLCFTGALLAAPGVRDTRAAGVAPGATDSAAFPPAVEERVYSSEEAARREIFPSASRFLAERRALDTGAREQLQRTLGTTVTEESLTVHRALGPDGTLLGYAVVSEEIGKYHPITFMVGASPDLKVERVTILVYRESHGGEVRRQRFLSQYRGKSFQSPIRINRDIVNISGATLSVRALNQGVRRVMGMLEAFYGPARP